MSQTTSPQPKDQTPKKADAKEREDKVRLQHKLDERTKNTKTKK